MSIHNILSAGLVLAACGATACVVHTPPPVVGSAASTVDWSTNLTGTAGDVGTQMTFYCPPNGSPSTVWGTDIYSDDSSVCTAAVHAGVIGFGGGMVHIVIQPGQSQYIPSTRYGVTSSSWGQWGRSFSFIP